MKTAEEKKEADKAKAEAGDQAPQEPAGDKKGPATAEIKTVGDLESLYPELVSEIRDEVITQIGKCPIKELKENMPELYERIAAYPELVSEIRDEVITQIGKCPVKDLKANMPELYERIAADVPSQGGPDLREPGFLLDIDDPFAAGALRTYARLRNLEGLHLPFVLPFKSKGKGDIRAEAWKKKFEESEALKAEFKKVDAYVAFKSKVVTQALEHYIQTADGAGDRERVAAARKAMKKIK